MRAFLLQFGAFTEDEIEYYESLAQKKTVKAKAVLFHADRPFLKMWFIHSGIVRCFRLIDGRDYSYFFFFNNEFAVDFESYLTEMPSPLFFEALTDVAYSEFSKQDIKSLYETFPRFHILGRIMAEKAYLSAAERLKQHQTDDLKTRYLKLIAKDPHLFHFIPQHHIASYLGVKPQSLSRIRAEVSGKKY